MFIEKKRYITDPVAFVCSEDNYYLVSYSQKYQGSTNYRIDRMNILLAEGCDDIFDYGKVIKVLDQTCGTGGMLSTSYNFIKRYNSTADVHLFGQEVNHESYAICLAEMMIKGQNAENICYQDTMRADRFKNTKMRFVIEKPSFGTPWDGKDAA